MELPPVPVLAASLMYTIRNNKIEIKKEITFGFDTFSHSFPLCEVCFFIHHFFCCNLNGKPPDVCLMLEESKICII